MLCIVFFLVSIETWFSHGRLTSPLTGMYLRSHQLLPNDPLKRAINEFRDNLPTLERDACMVIDLQACIQMREADLKDLASKGVNMIPRGDYDRVLEQCKIQEAEILKLRKIIDNIGGLIRNVDDDTGAAESSGSDLSNVEAEDSNSNISTNTNSNGNGRVGVVCENVIQYVEWVEQKDKTLRLIIEILKQSGLVLIFVWIYSVYCIIIYL